MANLSLESVSMVRVSGEQFPQFALPSGFSVTWYRPGCEAWWHDVQLRSDKLTSITRDTFGKYFGEALHELPRRQCFLLEPAGHPIGTATAWFDHNYHGQSWGRLHWVAILPKWQGRGLGKALMSAVCARLHDLHPERSFLRTAPQRLPAIHLYLQFGFEPEIRSPEDRLVWEDILAQLSAYGR
jgi:GNAT superfamily N-acetyltransferase